ncbi:MAG: GGDEF domain-containing protein [Planctomycetota bacterium]|nr:GGDEF domain-containing protein [Planctomycetota bacterium]
MVQSMPISKRGSRRERVETRLLKVLEERRLTPEIAEMMYVEEHTPCQTRRLNNLKNQYGDRFYSELLFTLTNQYFPRDDAKKLWSHIVTHRKFLCEQLNRPVSVILATLDWLEATSDRLKEPVIMPYRQLEATAEFAIRDALTNLFDRSAFTSKLQTEIVRYERYSTQLSVLMIDADNFKEVNDQYGHLEGDRVLQVIAKTLLTESRDLDTVGRFGGEEFVVLLPHTGLETALHLSERLCTAIEDKGEEIYQRTVSIGVANCPFNALTAEALLKKADEAMYEAKLAGKNQVRSALS